MTANGPGSAAVRRAGSPWTSPPERPARYWLHARLSDMAHGWLDGRHGLPRLPTAPDQTAQAGSEPGDGIHRAPVPGVPAGPGSHELELADQASAEPAADEPPPEVRTARMEVLTKQATELIEGEKILLKDELAVLKREAAGFLEVRDALAEKVTVTAAKLKEAQVPLTEEQRGDRRLAEQNDRDRPPGLVRIRRHASWERRLAAAEQEHQSVTASLAEATRQAELRMELIRDRGAVARAAARRHHELSLRRIATYLQQLLRKHPDGAELNHLLVEYRVGPELPDWTKDPGPQEDQTSDDHGPTTGTGGL